MSQSWAGLLSTHSFWYGKEPSSKIDVYCMLPNGICISCPSVAADMPLYKIKANVWEEAERYALFRLLLQKDSYVFVVVSSKGGVEEILDEDRSLYDVRPFRPYLKIVPRQGDEQEKKIKNDISRLIGRSIMTSAKTEEVEEFRIKYKNFCEDLSYQRGRSSWERRAIYTYPPDFEIEQEPSPQLQKKLEACGSAFQVVVSFAKTTSKIKITDQHYPGDIIELAIRKLTHNKADPSMRTDDYILKVLGRLDFFLGEVTVSMTGQECYLEKRIIQYKYIQECIIWDKTPNLVMLPKHAMDVGRVRAPTLDQGPPPVPKKGQNISKNEIILWDLSPATMFKIKIQCAMNINAGQMWKEVHCGLFHGREEVCQSTQTKKRQKGIHPSWNEYLEFNLPVARLPRMAKLCFCIVGYNQEKDAKKKKSAVPIAWVNYPVFNFKGRLNIGISRLECWPSGVKRHFGSHQFLNPLGTVASSGNDKGPCLLIEFMKFAHLIVYPSDDFVFEIAAMSVANNDQAKHPFLIKGGKQHRMQIERIIKKDTLMPMFEEDKELLWRLRADCCHDYPQSLPKLLECVKWDSRDDVAQIYFLLQSWRHNLEIEIALDLLDYKFPDMKVRSLAVEILDSLMDGELEMYLLQLVQALKYELYLDSPLASYLLRRALNNKRIGHYLFWHLKAEVGTPECSLQFGLLLEMYCRGAVSHIPSLLRQVEAINKLKTVTEILQSYKDQDNKKKLTLMRQCFEGDSYANAFSDLISPLDPSIKLKKLIVGKCKFMSSKKKPLWLVFEVDEGVNEYLIMFKNGDDLRQDMLTLLSLRLMDNVWKKAGLDYGIIPYKCLSTGPMVGLIEVVPNSDTLGRIQASKGAIRGVWNEKNLLSWLSEQTKGNNDKLDVFMNSFIRSVVGYSIATYVLGVGDRHNDNIMMKADTGQLFHIDFGHFLGNFKTKLGIRRERVKFVLTNDILYIISQCRFESSERSNFEIFKNMCIEAFKVLRSKGNLFITVFAMLLSTGIPELEQPENLDYLRDSLALVSDELDAVKHFEKSFNEANQNKTSTTMNWMFHNLNHHWIG